MSEKVAFRLETLGVKNLSVEVPESVVTPKFEDQPEVQLEMRSKTRPLSRDYYHEVVLEVTARVKNGSDLQVLIEVQHAGIFYVESDNSERRQRFLGIHAPTMMYPYLSHLIGEMMSYAGAPRVFLPPFDFAVVYEKKRELLRRKLEEDDDDGEEERSRV